MRKRLLSLLILSLGGLAFAQPSGLPVDVPREELFVADQIFRYAVTGNYNLWGSGGTPHRHDHGACCGRLGVHRQYPCRRHRHSGARAIGS